MEIASIGSDDSDFSSMSSGQKSVDVTVIKSLCDQMESLNKLLLKVDEDIEALEVTSDENKADCELLLDKVKVLEGQNGELGDKNRSLEQSLLALAAKDLVTRHEVEAKVKAVTRDEATNMIELAKSNFLRTVHGGFVEKLYGCSRAVMHIALF